MKPKERVVVEQFRKILHTKCRFLLNTTYSTRFTAEWTSYSYLWIWICVKSGLIYFRSRLSASLTNRVQLSMKILHAIPTSKILTYSYQY